MAALKPAPYFRFDMTHTIYAFATGLGSIAVLRISGPQTAEVLNRLGVSPLPPPRKASLRQLHVIAPRPQDASPNETAPKGCPELLDEALCFWFPAPESYTGDDLAELHLHGGLAVRQAMLDSLSHLSICRMAEAGEFTRRAVLNGRLDLTAAEAVADLVAAETEGQRRQALRQLGGALGTQLCEWYTQLAQSLAYTEANIDFVEEDDLPEDLAKSCIEDLSALQANLSELLKTAKAGEQMRSGFHIVILGAPNAGKSTLLNALACRDAAIVAPTAGTTRDVVEVRLDISGIPVILSDTAGLRSAEDVTEAEGVRRALDRARSADLVLFLHSVDHALDHQDDLEHLDDLRTFMNSLDQTSAHILPIVSKADLLAACSEPPDESSEWGIPLELQRLIPNLAASSPLMLSLAPSHSSGLDDVIAAIKAAAQTQTGDGGLLTRQRHRDAIREAVDEIGFAIRCDAVELRAEHIRRALGAIGCLTGDLGFAKIGVEDLLDIVFNDFCIGK